MTNALLDLDGVSPVWLPPPRFCLRKRNSMYMDGAAGLLAHLKAEPRPLPPQTKTTLQKQQEARKNQMYEKRKSFQNQKLSWNPNSDENIRGTDPNSTIILARLDYKTTTEDINREFDRFGHIVKIRLVEGPKGPRGYAFVLFSTPTAARAAVETTGGEIMLLGRRVIIDLERARVKRNWKPRRLGGGEGGRFSLERQRAEVTRHHNILKRGLTSLNPPQPRFSRQDDRGPEKRVHSSRQLRQY